MDLVATILANAAELDSMVRFVRACGSATFWGAIAAIAASGHGEASDKAHWAQLARGNVPVIQWVRSECHRAIVDPAYAPVVRFADRIDAASRKSQIQRSTPT